MLATSSTKTFPTNIISQHKVVNASMLILLLYGETFLRYSVKVSSNYIGNNSTVNELYLEYSESYFNKLHYGRFKWKLEQQNFAWRNFSSQRTCVINSMYGTDTVETKDVKFKISGCMGLVALRSKDFSKIYFTGCF